MTYENKSEYQIWSHLQWIPSDKQLKQFRSLQSLLKEWNKQVNLTKLVEGNDFWISQILDSLWPFKSELRDQSQSLKIIDVGSGCGLPGLAIAIVLPHSSVTLVDSISKKTAAVHKIISALNLQSRVNIRTERIELTGQKISYRYGFDIALARAVAQGPVLAEYLIPLLKPSGEAILYKGKWSSNDNENVLKALSHLKGNIKKVEAFQLPKKRGIRHIIRLERKDLCPKKYPRPIGQALKKPLNNYIDDNL